MNVSGALILSREPRKDASRREYVQRSEFRAKRFGVRRLGAAFFRANSRDLRQENSRPCGDG
jgi:hypothetical protein